MSCLPNRTSDTAENTILSRLSEALPGGNFIRLMILEPGEHEDELSCVIQLMNLDNPVSYEAISYVWESTHRDHPIQISGQTFQITANLDRTLRRMRSRVTPRTLWADSVCINQDDLAERASQVLLMGQVYQTAKRVLMYLGEDDDSHGEAVKSLVSEIDDMVIDGIRRTGESWNSFPILNSDEQEVYLADTRWHSLILMTHQSWFTRGWVVQEASLAASGLMLWGLTEIPWRSFLNTYTWMIRRLPQVRVKYGDDSRGMNRLHLELYRMQNKAETMPLYTKQAIEFDFLIILHDARALSVKDQRDRVYAFMCLASTAGLNLHIRPNYSDETRPKDVYLDLARGYLQSTGNLNILHCVQHTEASFHDKFPSWVPRWDLNLFDNIVTHTSAPTLIPTEVKPVVSRDNILHVTGVIFDEVIFASKTLSRDVSIHDIKTIWDQVSESHSASAYSPAFKALAFSQILAMGRSWGAEWPEWVSWRTAYINLCLGQSGYVSKADEPLNNGINAFHTYAQWNMHNRRIVVTRRGFYGVVPHTTEPGDLTCVLFGAKSCSVLRKSSTPGRYRLVGDAYIPGNSPPRYRNGGDVIPSAGFENYRDWASWVSEDQVISLC
ncbi:hypothetical protein N7466_010171 [Penicillium verhagenii]|uniref:uncharacterized protein n=1 Tax=Penicillium verhagenii TaxID=1562060 RepID=UPI0025452435|nr:uncharacterized protein N7466_010171 [Penicillium verhagenii]KAJ5919228.1 hypothetical protein N7466_010171 [Penicillium verhagenii]